MSNSSHMPVLEAKHFLDVDAGITYFVNAVTFTSGGLRSELSIAEESRTLFANELPLKEPARFLAYISTLRAQTVVRINPEQTSLETLLSYFKQTDIESIDVGWKAPDAYDRQWHTARDEGGATSQGQKIVMVAYDRDDPVGFSNVEVGLRHSQKDGQLTAHFDLNMVYVAPQRRGQGFGLDLSIACGALCESVLKAVYRAAPSNTKIIPVVAAEFESEGGRRFSGQVVAMLECTIADLKEFDKDGVRRSVSIDNPEFDAGW